MSVKTYNLISLMIMLALAGFLVWAIITDTALYIVIIVFVLALLMLSVSRRGTKETMVDERLQAISEKAASGSYRLSVLLMAIVGLTFLVLGDSLVYEYSVIGATLAYTACGMMVVHLGLYYYLKSRS